MRRRIVNLSSTFFVGLVREYGYMYMYMKQGSNINTVVRAYKDYTKLSTVVSPT